MRETTVADYKPRRGGKDPPHRYCRSHLILNKIKMIVSKIN